MFLLGDRHFWSHVPSGGGYTLPYPLQEVLILLECFLVTSRNEVLAKVIFSQAVILSTGVGGYPSMPCRSVPGGWVSQHALQVSPGGVGIPACLAGQSRGGGYPSMPCKSVLGGSPIFRGVSNTPPIFLGGEFFFDFCFLWGYTPPRGPDTGIRSTFGRYASYWNAFLLIIILHLLRNHFLHICYHTQIHVEVRV